MIISRFYTSHINDSAYGLKYDLTFDLSILVTKSCAGGFTALIHAYTFRCDEAWIRNLYYPSAPKPDNVQNVYGDYSNYREDILSTYPDLKQYLICESKRK